MGGWEASEWWEEWNIVGDTESLLLSYFCDSINGHWDYWEV